VGIYVYMAVYMKIMIVFDVTKLYGFTSQKIVKVTASMLHNMEPTFIHAL
jgi:hypothetical protein